MKANSINKETYAKLGAKICYLCELNGVKYTSLTKVINVTEKTLRDRRANPYKFTVEELSLIANNFRINLSDLFI